MDVPSYAYRISVVTWVANRQAGIVSVSTYSKTPNLALCFLLVFAVGGFHKAKVYLDIADAHSNLAWPIRNVAARNLFLSRLDAWGALVRSEDLYLAAIPILTSDISYIGHCLVVAAHSTVAFVNRLKVMSIINPSADKLARLKTALSFNVLCVGFMAVAAIGDLAYQTALSHELFAGSEFLTFFADSIWCSLAIVYLL
ncbi:hypothetical protein MTO96_004942 [Rhipicephalus appendiculatus]